MGQFQVSFYKNGMLYGVLTQKPLSLYLSRTSYF